MAGLRHGTPLKKLDEKELLAVAGGEHVSRPDWTMQDYIEIGRAWRRGGLTQAIAVRWQLEKEEG